MFAQNYSTRRVHTENYELVPSGVEDPIFHLLVDVQDTEDR